MNTLIRFTLATLLALIATSFTHAGDKITYIHNDALGSPVAATNQLGQVIWRETYKPHGQRTTNAAASTNNKVWFTGKQEESALGINYFGARWYHPEVGRFLVIDPVGVSPENIHSFNRYGYANNNPYGFVDPDGREAACVSLGGCNLNISPTKAALCVDSGRRHRQTSHMSGHFIRRCPCTSGPFRMPKPVSVSCSMPALAKVRRSYRGAVPKLPCWCPSKSGGGCRRRLVPPSSSCC